MRRFNPYDELFFLANELSFVSLQHVCSKGNEIHNIEVVLSGIVGRITEVNCFIEGLDIKEKDFLFEDSIVNTEAFKNNPESFRVRISQFDGIDKSQQFVSKNYLIHYLGEKDGLAVYEHRVRLNTLANQYKQEFLLTALEQFHSDDVNDGIREFRGRLGDCVTEGDFMFMLACKPFGDLFYK